MPSSKTNTTDATSNSSDFKAQLKSVSSTISEKRKEVDVQEQELSATFMPVFMELIDQRDFVGARELLSVLSSSPLKSHAASILIQNRHATTTP